jgi:hypothetical protein
MDPHGTPAASHPLSIAVFTAVRFLDFFCNTPAVGPYVVVRVGSKGAANKSHSEKSRRVMLARTKVLAATVLSAAMISGMASPAKAGSAAAAASGGWGGSAAAAASGGGGGYWTFGR